jgi:sugar phosphate permease
MNNWTPSKAWPWKVCIFLLFATTLSYLDRNAFSVVAPVIQEDFNWDNETIGRVLSAFFFAYGLMHLVVGFILDRKNIRVTYGLFVLFWSISQMLTSLSKGFLSLFAARFSLGIFESAGHPGGVRIIARIIPRKDRTLANSMLISGGSFGALIAPPLMILLHNTVGWRYGFVMLGGLGLLWSALWLMWFRPPDHILTGKQDGVRKLVKEDEWGNIIRNPKFWASIAGALLVIPIIHVTYSWVSIFFVQEWGMELEKDLAANLLIIALGFEAALYVTGALVSILSRKGVESGTARKYILIGAAILMASVAFITTSPSVKISVVFLFCLNFGRASFNPIFYSFIQEISPQRVGTIAGIMGAIGAFSGALIINLVGKISGEGFTVTFIIIGCIAVLGILPMLFIKWEA